MLISGFWSIFVVGSFGGIAGEILHWYSIRTSDAFPEYGKHARYWVATALMILSGGLLSVLYGVEPKSAILVVQIGLTAPLLIKAIAQTRPYKVQKDISGKPSIFEFIAGR